MKKGLCLFLAIAALPLFGNDKEIVDKELVSEALGHLIVRHLVHPGFEFSVDKIIQGMKDERSGKPSPLSEEEYEKTIYTIQENLFLQTAAQNLTEANAFLKLNAGEQDVKILDEKLQYKVAQEGHGEIVNLESTPLIHYQGKLLNGTVFTNSHDQESPISLPIKQTIPGFAKGLVGMKEGEKRILYIHPELAYGVTGHLPPNSLLIFEVEIVKADGQVNETAIASQEEPVPPPA